MGKYKINVTLIGNQNIELENLFFSLNDEIETNYRGRILSVQR